MAAVGTKQVRYHEKIVKNINDVFHIFFHGDLNLTEVRDSDLKKTFSWNFQFHRRDPTTQMSKNL